MKNIILLLSTFIMTVSCRYENTADCHQVLTFENTTNKHIYVSSSFKYPNTEAFKYHPDPLLSPVDSKIEALEENTHILSGRTCYEVSLENAESSIIMVYVFDGTTLETSTWQTVKDNNLVLKRYDLTLEDLEGMNWEIIYDGEKEN